MYVCPCYTEILPESQMQDASKHMVQPRGQQNVAGETDDISEVVISGLSQTETEIADKIKVEKAKLHTKQMNSTENDILKNFLVLQET